LFPLARIRELKSRWGDRDWRRRQARVATRRRRRREKKRKRDNIDSASQPI
jgi:hypothetical protein